MPETTLLLLALAEKHVELGTQMAELALRLSDAHPPIDVLTLAQAIQGEGAALFGEERDRVATWIAHTAYNRWQKPYWKRIDGVDCTFAARVEYDWHGSANVQGDVEPWAVRIAYQVLNDRRNGGEDQAKGALFAMTLTDLEEHGWMEHARSLVVDVIVHPDDPLVQFWFLSRFPGPKEAQ